MIVTLTLSPALDLTYSLVETVVGEVDVHRATEASIEASGKGVNVSRALHANKAHTMAVLPLGGSPGHHLSELLDAEQVPHRVVAGKSPTRINTTLAVAGGGTAKVNGPGAELTHANVQALLDEIKTALQHADGHDDWLAICGSLPPGAPPVVIGEFVAVAHEFGARCAVDASGAALVAAIAAGADLLAPNRLELADVEPSVEAAHTLPEIAQVAAGIARATGASVLLSMGHDGALFTDGTETIHGRGAELVPINTAGAGDALLAGWLAGSDTPTERMTRAIRWSRAACLASTTVAPALTDLAAAEPITVTPLPGTLVPITSISSERHTPMSVNRRIVVTAVESMELRDEPMPVPAAGEVRVRSVYIGVCGSDTHAFHGRHPFIPIPYNPGHEATGVIEELGEGVDSVKVGDRVVVEPTLPCWDCKPCRNGNENLCENLQFFGCGYEQGGMADQFVVRADRLHHIPDSISDLGSALIEPLSTPVHAGRIAGPLKDRTVVVLGAGTIGLLMLAVARYSGASKVVVTDPLASKREAAMRIGADAAIDAMDPDVAALVRAELGESADVVFDCVAVKSTTLAGIEMALKGGTVVIVGVPSADFELPIRIMQDQQIRIQGSATYVPQDYATSIEMIASGAVRAEDFITGEFPLDQAEQAFEASVSGDHIKVLIHP